MGGANGDIKDGSKSIANSIFLVTILVYALAIAYLVYHLVASGKFMSVAEGFFQLTEGDVSMIPVGAVAFFIFWKIFDSFIFSPHMKVVEERENQTTGAIDDAVEIKKEIAEKEDQIRTEILKLRKELTSNNEKILKEKELERQALITSRSLELQTKLKEENLKLNSQKESLEKNLFSEADQMVSNLVLKLNEVPKFASKGLSN
jgi:F0F1-type ATP synthase membrane subunit b/b'